MWEWIAGPKDRLGLESVRRVVKEHVGWHLAVDVHGFISEVLRKI